MYPLAHDPKVEWDMTEQDALDIMTTLSERGARIQYSDPFVPTLAFGGQRLKSVSLTPARLRGFDCVVIATAHTGFPYRAIVRHAKGVVDTRNALRGRRAKKIIRI